jgi:autotransporter-associated beta strand protein
MMPFSITRVFRSGPPIATVALTITALLAAVSAAVAQTWSATPQDNLWGNPNNWTPTTVPGSGATATFSSSSTVTALSLGGGVQPINTIAFAVGTVSYNLGITAGDQFSIDAGGAITEAATITAGQTFSAGVIANGALAVTNSGSGTITFNGPISGSAGLVTFSGAGSGTVFLNAQNTYGGGTSFGGTAQMPIRLGVSTVLDVGGAILSGPFGTGTVTSNNGTPIILEPSGGDRTIANPFSFVFGLFFANDSTGNFNLTLTGPKNLTTSNRVLTNNMNAGPFLTFGLPGTTTLFNLGTTGGRTVTFQTTTQTAATTAAGAATTVLNDVVANSTNAAAGSIVVQNNANLVLTNANTYTGTTLVSGGRLMVNNTTGSGTGTGIVTARGTVANATGGGTLGGTGSIAGLVNIGSTTASQQGGILSPGNNILSLPGSRIGRLTVGTGITTAAPAMSWKPFGSYNFDHQPDATQFSGAGGTPNPGVDNDHVTTTSTTGTLDLSGLNNTSSSTQFTVSLIPNFTTASFNPTGPVDYAAATFPSIALPAAPTTPFNSITLANGQPATDVSSLFNFGTTGFVGSTPIAGVSGGVLYFEFTPVPEPGFVLAACGGLAGLVGWWRRRRRA